MEIQGRDVVEKAQFVKIPESSKRRDLLRAFDQRWTESVGIVHRNIERLHQRAGNLGDTGANHPDNWVGGLASSDLGKEIQA